MTRNVLEYLERSAAACPDRTAVADETARLSFHQLRQDAARLGERLRGTCADRPVGVVAARRADTVMYFMAALYGGAYYVPLDPDMPPEKLRSILDEAEVDTVLADPRDTALLETLSYGGAVLSRTDMAETAAPIPETGGDEPLFLIYTSGSTGKPKGILKSHGAECSFIEAYLATFDFSENEVIGNQTPFFFDASSKDLYLMLALGCTMEIIPTKLFSFPMDLADYLNERRVSFISWVPTALSIMAQLNIFKDAELKTIRKVFFVGEVMPMKYLNKWRKAMPDVQYVNLYGQSELAGICCYYEVRGTFADSDTLPIGVPLCNSKIRLLDGEGRVIEAPGTIGEIHISSDALALEYFHDPEKTAASFLVRDFGAGPERCFKTGDLAQYNENGELVFAARSDFQIKHMGHRIELGEIEAIAGSLAEIGRCCCLYQAEKQKIVLFCELAPGFTATGQEIRSLLRGKLSDYMLPRQVQILEKLPLNPNGKLDRTALKTRLK